MTPERWARIKEVFQAAVERREAERTDFVAGACGSDDDMRREVESLLREQSTPEWLKTPVRPADLRGQISHYRIVERLGQGGMGVVYKAEDLKLGRVVALKFLAPNVCLSDHARSRFVREAKALAAIDHPNICAVHDIDEAQGQLFLAMSFVDGPTLREKIAEGTLSLDQALRIVIDAAQGLHAAHTSGIVHHDIKSGNIMLNADGRTLITDFGLACPENDASTSQAGLLIGTPSYLSPEQVRGEKADRRSDLWSLGIVLYEAVTGQLPFRADVMPGSILTDDPPPVSSLRPDAPPELDRILSKALAKAPSKRYQSAADLAADLKRVLEPGRKETRRRWRTVRKRLVLALFAPAMLLMAAVIALWVRSSDPPDLRQSIAVLPLQNLSGDPGQQYFTDGMTDAIITDLARIAALRVVSRGTSMVYSTRPDPMRAIARDFHVHYLVEGSVLRAGDRVRITVQLVESKNDRHVWAQNYEGDLRNILLLQSNVAQAIAREIRARLTPGEEARLAKASRVNPKAYEAFLKGRHLMLKWVRSDIAKGREYYLQALAEDPNYALAYAGLADSYITEGFYWGVRPADLWPQAERWALRAFQLDPDLAGPHRVLSLVHGIYGHNWEQAMRDIERSIELDPNSEWSHYTYAVFHLLPAGRFEAALREVQLARDTAPLSPNIAAMAGWIRFFRREYALAADLFQSTLELDPAFDYAQEGLAFSLAKQGKLSEAGAAAAQPEVVAWVRALEGKRAEALAILNDLIERSRREYVGGYELALVYVALGDHGLALDQLERGYRDCQPQLANLKVDPRLDALRSEPRFLALVRQMNLGN